MEVADNFQSEKRQYFVAYTYWKSNGNVGVGSRMVEMSRPVSDWDAILEMSNYILSHNPDMEKVSISFWRKFEDPE
jgi:hypothetical protein